MCVMVKSRYIGDGHPTFNRNPYNGYINPYYWVDDHPLLYGNNGSLDPGTCKKKNAIPPQREKHAPWNGERRTSIASHREKKRGMSLTRLDWNGQGIPLKRGISACSVQTNLS